MKTGYIEVSPTLDRKFYVDGKLQIYDGQIATAKRPNDPLVKTESELLQDLIELRRREQLIQKCRKSIISILTGPALDEGEEETK